MSGPGGGDGADDRRDDADVAGGPDDADVGGGRTAGEEGGEDAPSLTLSAALKLSGFAGTGGEAKRRIQDGEVLVNGAVETRRKRRLVEGDEITVDGESFVLELEDEAE